VTFHDQHHEKFKYNFATHFSWWDRLMGTLDPTYDDRVKAFAADSQPVDAGQKPGSGPRG